MPTYQYTAQNRDNEPVSGTLEADSHGAALTELTNRGLHAVQITPAEPADSESSQSSADDTSPRAEVVFDEEIGAPLEQITGAGLPLESGLRILAESHPSSRASRNLLQLSNRLAQGESWGFECFNFPTHGCDFRRFAGID